MKRVILLAATVTALAFGASASAALVPWTFVQSGQQCAPTSTVSNGTLHLSKPCTTATVASAGATITGVNGQPFTSASFALPNASQCQGGSPRFNITTTTGTTYFLGCNNVTPTTNADGSLTYTFTAATIAAGGNQVPVPVGNITDAEVLIDVQGSADVSNITLNGQAQNLAPTPTSKKDCKHGGWRNFSPPFRNQGQCVKFVKHLKHAQKHDEHGKHHESKHHGS